MSIDDSGNGTRGRAEAGPLNHQQLIITLFGFYGRSHGGALPVAGLIRLMADLGVDAPAVRSSISRLKKRGVLRSVKISGLSGYALAPGLEETFREGDERIFGARRAALTDHWILAVFTVPEKQRHLRHQIRSGLIRMGFGAVAPGVWIAPEHLRGAAHAYMDRHDLSQYIDWFRGDYLGAREMSDAVGQWWDLAALEAQYADFVARHAPVRERWIEDAGAAGDGERERAAFAAYITMVTEWRRLPYLDPGLPLELLPEGWHGMVAERLFGELHRQLQAPAEVHARRVLAGAE
ncbi:PaaX family transcriptional regulator C-terminal domain-containing protein [Kocuria sp. M1R5S2]|uniref:PaaX family transcriptional regulator n=1 Tax=Kocuria rhizosphaerae TaxID=3376285 RepID=UPI00379861DD